MRFEPGDRGRLNLGRFEPAGVWFTPSADGGRIWRGAVAKIRGGSQGHRRGLLVWPPPSPVLDPDRRAHETERITDLIFQEALVGEM